MEKARKSLEVCFSSKLYDEYKRQDTIVVVVDILRASSSICTAFMHGVEKIIPVATLDEAKEFKEKGYTVASERDGKVVDFADFGNSPHNFTSEDIKGKTIVYSTTNGTNTIHMAKDCHQVLIGAFLNIRALCDYLDAEKHDVVILCAGWKKKFNIEDTLFAGALSDCLLKSGSFKTNCDSVKASVDLWSLAADDPDEYIKKIAWLKRLGMNDVLNYCFKFNLTNIIPVLEKSYLVPLKS